MTRELPFAFCLLAVLIVYQTAAVAASAAADNDRLPCRMAGKILKRHTMLMESLGSGKSRFMSGMSFRQSNNRNSGMYRMSRFLSFSRVRAGRVRSDHEEMDAARKAAQAKERIMSTSTRNLVAVLAACCCC